ncbi:unnamed protein product [Amoebophrya sp. A120]|nr:unnamed protein product [Amoebophrya sp. A120]|eukprot:GSA120T00003911001.1
MPEAVQTLLTEQPDVAAVKEEVATQDDVIVEGPAPTKEFNEKKLKVIVKEGGKRGVEIEGAADMGGLQFFCTMIEKPEGDLDLLIESMKAMNAKSNPSEEERKGGAGKIGKIIFSCTEKAFSAVAYVPKNKADECSAFEWLSEVVNNVAGAKGVKLVKTFDNIESKYWAAVCVPFSHEEELYPIKMRDPAISHAYTYLKKKGLFPEDDSDDEDDYVFGDDDFP